MANGGRGSHWTGCEEVHHDCAIAKLAAAQAEIATLRAVLAEMDCETVGDAYAGQDIRHDPNCVKCAALAQPSDTSALDAVRAQERERVADGVAKIALGKHHPDTLWACVDVIRALGSEPQEGAKG